MTETALIVSATAPVPVDNGKRVMLHGMVGYLVERLGPQNVHYAVLDDAGAARPDFDGVAHRLRRPGAPAQLATLARRLPFDRAVSVQEALLGAPSLRDQVHDLVAWLRPDIEVYDTLRMGQHAPPQPRGRRRVLYLEDLFSARYERMLAVQAEHGIDIDPLGEFAANVPGPMRLLARRPIVYRPLLRMERDRIRRRERQVVADFDVNLLVNAAEVAELRAGSQADVRVVHGLLPRTTAPVRLPADPPEIVFLGRLNIPHNDDAVCSFLRSAMPGVLERIPQVRLRVIGKDPSDRLRALAAPFGDRVRLEGFVADLDEVFSAASVALAPLRFGSGVKIKMLEAFARGLPVVATTTAVEGIAVQPEGVDGCQVCDDLDRWPDLIADLVERDRNAKASDAARAFFVREYDRDVVTAQYDRIFGLASAESAAAQDEHPGP